LSLLFFQGVFFITLAEAANFSWSAKSLEIKGAIEKGDYEKLISIIEYMNYPPLMVLLDSNGGQVEDAIKIGSFFRSMDISAVVAGDGVCASACTLILIGSTNRIVSSGAMVGIHRTFIDPRIYAKFTNKEAQKIYSQLKSAVEAYLKEMGANAQFIEKMYNTPSNDILWLSSDEFYDLVPERPEYIVELSLARCGLGLTEKEIQILFFDKSNPFGKKEKQVMEEQYFKHMTCEMNLAAKERKAFLDKHGIQTGLAKGINFSYDFKFRLVNGQFVVSEKIPTGISANVKEHYSLDENPFAEFVD